MSNSCNTEKESIEAILKTYKKLRQEVYDKGGVSKGPHINSKGESLEEEINYLRSVLKGDIPIDSYLEDSVKREYSLKNDLTSRTGNTVTGTIRRKGAAHTGAKQRFNVLDVELSGRTFRLKVSDKSNKEYTFDFSKEHSSYFGAYSEVSSNGYVFKVEGIGSKLDDVYLNYEIKSFKQNRPSNEKVGKYMNQMFDILNGVGSSSRNLNDLKRTASYIEETDYTHGEVGHMKNVMRKLAILDTTAVDDSIIDYYESLFDKMHLSFFNDMKLFISQNENNDTYGWVDVKDREINISVGKPKSALSQSAAEVYTHEVLHTMVEWAMGQDTPEVSKLKRKLSSLRKSVISKVDYTVFLKDTNNPTELEISTAKEMFDYVFKSKNTDLEFISYGLTNPNFMQALMKIPLKDDAISPTVFGKLKYFLNVLLDIVMGNFEFNAKNKTAHEQLIKLAYKLGELNNSTSAQIEESNPFKIAKLWEEFEEFDTTIGDKVHNLSRKLFSNKNELEQYDNLGSRFEKAMYIIKGLAKSTYTPEVRSALSALARSYGLKTNGTVQEILSRLFDPDELKKSAEFLILKSTGIDMHRNSQIESVKRSIKSAFKKPPSELEESAITDVLIDTNASSLLYKKPGTKSYTNAEIRSMLTDEEALKGKKSKATKRLRDMLVARGRTPDYVEWTINQSVGLGYFMATHTGHEAQNLNSRNIAKGILSRNRFKLDEEIINAIDEVASLTALAYTDKGNKELVAKIMKEEYLAIGNIADVYETFKKNSKEELFKGDEAHVMSGYTKELFDDTIDVKVVSLSKKDEMKSLGYTLHREIPTQKLGNDEYGYFISREFTKKERLRGIVALGGNAARGSSLRQFRYRDEQDAVMARVKFELDLAEANNKAFDIFKEMTKADYDPSKVKNTKLPLLDAAGKVVDYRYTMPKKGKERLLNQNKNVSDVLARSMGSIVDKVSREELNRETLELIKDDMKENWKEGTLGKNALTEYTLIGPNADERGKELYYMLPKNMQSFINNRDDKTMAIRTDLEFMYLGYPQMALSNAFLINKLPEGIKKVIDMFEAYFIDLVKIAKGNILLKMPLVITGNIISNIIFGIVTGTDPFKIIGMYIESFRDAKSFIDNHKESISLINKIEESKAKLQRSSNKEAIKKEILRDENKLIEVKKEMEKSSIKELVDLGMYQSYIEDAEVSQLDESNRITDKLDRALKPVPELVKTPLQIAYLSKETTWYKVNQSLLQLSDLIARDVMNKKLKHLEKRQIEGKSTLPEWFITKLKEDNPGRVDISDKMELNDKDKELFLSLSKKVRHYSLLEAFVNYQIPNSRFEEYLNKIGLLMFSKYIKSIQRVVLKSGSKYPVKTAISVLGGNFVMGLETIQDQSYLARAFEFGEFSFSNIVPGYNPIDHIENVLTPALLKPETYTLF